MLTYKYCRCSKHKNCLKNQKFGFNIPFNTFCAFVSDFCVCIFLQMQERHLVVGLNPEND